MRTTVRTVRQQDESLGQVTDPFGRSALRLAYHIRRYALLYVCGALGALALSLFPTVAGGGLGNGLAAGGSNQYGNPSQFQAGSTAGAGGVTTGGPGAAAGGSGGTGSGAIAANGPSTAAGVGTAQAGAGTTRGGFPCKPGVRQLPFSQYAAPCVGQFTGNNGGATYNGVTPNQITIAMRHTSDSSGPNSAA
ncbi:MAG TPA: hypothetical protein VGF64_03860, partial [Acidimicrobiales bacterium]